MHPFLRSPRHILLMGLFWGPIVFCVTLLQSSLSGSTLSDAALLVGPPMVIQLFICLSIWFPCKTIAIDRYNFLQVVARHVLAAVFMTSLWMLLSALYVEILGNFMEEAKWKVFFDDAFLLLMGTGLFLYFMFALIYYMVLALDKGRKAEQNALENLLAASAAELSSLKASIHPHFLFNSLTSLSVLTRKSPELAQKTSLQLADFLRYSLNYGQQEWARIQDEIEHIKDYLGIEKLRLGDRLQVDYIIDHDALKEELPPFTLLPLIENAVKHGFEQSLEPGTLTLSVRKAPKKMTIEVVNPYDEDSRAKHGEGFGLIGLNKRLRNAYNGEADVVISKNQGVFKVTLTLPLRDREDE
jgi:sensor histidine kinase YesM